MLVVNFVASFVVEEAIVENRSFWGLLKRAAGHRSSSRYKKLRRDLEEDASWPPWNKTDFSGATHINPGFESHEEPAGRPAWSLGP
ncbi:hypothetical protein JD844_014007 [Phrynosoma platyrhinos]|uniref:Uncharacterized protein n=1 Tax=Phrynosoma platyrhinos TaxID=52577 RepID=A0ABQ7TMX6_PHRPL|nr:hypothetical protein JD844_014007 [Phrynosoma platyrhinos]